MDPVYRLALVITLKVTTRKVDCVCVRLTQQITPVHQITHVIQITKCVCHTPQTTTAQCQQVYLWSVTKAMVTLMSKVAQMPTKTGHSAVMGRTNVVAKTQRVQIVDQITTTSVVTPTRFRSTFIQQHTAVHRDRLLTCMVNVVPQKISIALHILVVTHSQRMIAVRLRVVKEKIMLLFATNANLFVDICRLLMPLHQPKSTKTTRG